MSLMKGINSYFRQLSNKQIEDRAHREFVGGLWDELGNLQFDFLVESGLRPEHRLLDIGCGCLRGGIHYVRYLDHGNYSGLDINESLIKAGMLEIKEAGLGDKVPNLLVDDKFSFEKFATQFDFMVSVSVFTHLPMNIIVRCLSNARKSLAPGGVYFSSFFEAPAPAHTESIKQQPGGVVTNYDADPFHYVRDELAYLAGIAGLELDVVGDWGHPRNQKMAAFRVRQ